MTVKPILIIVMENTARGYGWITLGGIAFYTMKMGLKPALAGLETGHFLVMKETSFLRDGKGIKTDCRSGLETRQLWECCN